MGLAAVGWLRPGIVVVVVVVVVEVETGALVGGDEVPGTEALAPHPAMMQRLTATTTPRAKRAEVTDLSDRGSGTS
jgi:hypothetical protein